MPGFNSSLSNNNNCVFANNADFSGSVSPADVNGLQTDNQLWLGSTALNAGGTHINVKTLTAGTGITFTPSANALTISLTGGAASVSITGDTGTTITGNSFTIYTDQTVQNSGSSVGFNNGSGISTLNVTDASGNTIIGNKAGNSSLTGTNNTALGANALTALTSGINNVILGVNAGLALTSGQKNVAIGTAALKACISSNSNVCVGNNAGVALTSGSNTLIGFQAGNGITSGATNTCLGEESGSVYTTESSNIVIGPALAGLAGDSSVCRIANIYGTQPSTSQTGSSGASPVGVNSSGQLGSSLYRQVTGSSSTITYADSIVGVNYAGAVTLTLPAVTHLATPQIWTFKDESGAAGTNNITITTGNGALNIDGAETKVINTNYGSIDVYYNGTQYYVF